MPTRARRVAAARQARLLTCLSCALAAVSCDGGGAGGGAAEDSSVPTAPHFAFATASVVAQSSTANSTAGVATVEFTLTEAAGTAGGSVPVPKVTWSGDAIEAAGAGIGGATPTSAGTQVFQGTVTITTWAGAALGSGSYKGAVMLQLCNDASATTCNGQVGGGPQSLSVTLQVSGAPRPATTISFTPAAIDAQGAVTQGAIAPVALPVQLSQPSPPVYLSLVQPSASVVGGIGYSSLSASNGTLSVQLRPPSSLEAGVHSGMLQVNACLDEACQRPLQNSPATIPVTYRVIPLAGLNRWFQGGFAGKKVVFWGNSTISNATYLFQEFDTYTVAGSALAGLAPANVLNYGNNGASLAALLAGEGPFPIAAVIAAKPDLLVIRGPLIDDVRLGQTDLTQATQLLHQALDQITAGTPDTDILLTSENSLLTTDVGGHGYVQPNSAAQQYTDILHDAVLAMQGLYPHVEVYDIMALEYGTICQPTSPLMADQLHPSQAGQTLEADLLLKAVGLPLLAD
jgi:hypothetical protein